MNDEEVWGFEHSLWCADPEHYHESIDDACLMIIAAPPYIMTGAAAADRVANTPRWEKIEFSEQRVARPDDGLIVIAYRIMAEKSGAEPYDARCTSVYREREGKWTVIEHQQAPVLAH